LNIVYDTHLLSKRAHKEENYKMVGTTTPPSMNAESTNNKSTTTTAAKTEASERPINNIALAAMLRESAAFVEKDEFDPILYQALTDFRLYYKQHLPKKKKVKKKVTTTTTTTTTTTAGDKEGPNSSSLDGTATTTASSQSTAAAVAVAVAVAVVAEPTPTVERPASPQDSKESSFRSDIDDVSKEFGGSVHVASPPVVPRATVASPVATTTATTATESSSASTVQKHHGSAAAMFASFQFPKMHFQIPNPAFAATSKKNAQRAKADLSEMFAADLAPKAESSARRKVVEVAAATAAQAQQEEAAKSTTATIPKRPSQASTTCASISEAGWCEEHFTMGCACKLSAPVASTDIGPDAARPKMTTPTQDDGSFVSKDQSSTATSDFRSSRSLDTFQSHYNNDATVTGEAVVPWTATTTIMQPSPQAQEPLLL
jgi:hypothetical protein